MAFPTIAGVATSTPAASTAVSVSLPPGIAPGDLLIAMIATTFSNTNTTWPAGWTEFHEQISTLITTSFAYRIANGSEGSTITVTQSTSATPAALVYRITGHHTSSPPEVGTAPAISTTANADPPSVTPSWGTEDALWIAVAVDDLDQAVPTAYPANYTLSQTSVVSNTTNSITLAAAGRQLRAASEDPGAYSFASAADATAQTIAVRPAIPGSAALIFLSNPFSPLLVR